MDLYRRLWSTHTRGGKSPVFFFLHFFSGPIILGVGGVRTMFKKQCLMSSGKTCWFFCFVNVFSLFWGPSPR